MREQIGHPGVETAPPAEAGDTRFLEFALRIARLGAWELDLEDHSARRSLEHDRIFGYEQLLPEWTYDLFLQHVLPEDRPGVDAAFRRAVDTHGDWQFEARIQTAKGEVRWIWAAGTHRTGEDGRAKLAGVVQDITERRNADAARLEHRRRLRWVLDTTGVGSWLNELPLGALNWDARTRELFFLQPDEVPTAELFWQRLHPDDREPTRLAVEQAIRDGTRYDVEHRAVDPRTGAVRWIRSAGQASYHADGTPARFDGINYDITERKRAAASIAESEERLRALADSIPQLAWIARPDGHITWYNRRWYEYTGSTPAQMEGWGWQSVHDPVALPEVLRQWTESITTGKPFEMEFPLRGADGRYRRFLTRCEPLRDAAGSVLGWFGTNTDVTELVTAKEALAEADRRKTAFLAILSHELRNPLAPIRNALFLLDRATPGSDSARRARTILHRQTEHLSRLVDDLLDVARISGGKIELRRSRLDARDVARRCMDDLHAAFEQRGVALMKAASEPVWVHADGARLAQMVGNLLHNALKFTPPGGRVDVSVQARGRTCQISVRDTGMGIAAEDLATLFRPFAQAERTRRHSRGGLGIGLSLVHELATLHGGSVRASSAGVGAGAEFVIELPLAPGAGADAPPPEAPQAAPGLSVLVVEDNEDAAATLSDVLGWMGHRVRTVGTGAAAVDAATAEMPEVLICDVGLPDMGGYEVIRAIRAAAGGRRVFAVAVTGYAQPDDREAALQAGFDAHLAKPPPLEELQALLAGAARREVEQGGPRT